MLLVNYQQFSGVEQEISEMICLRNNAKWKTWIFPVICLLLSGCGRFDWYSPPRPNTGGTVIYSTAQASFRCNDNFVSLASGNYHTSEFIDEFGEVRTGNISGLWVGMKDKPEAFRFYYVYYGLVIYYYDVKIEILQVGGDYTAVEVSAFVQSGRTERCYGV
ncbi:MAG: hypothetical protein JW748_07585 [Anaerolineales bacterium]|nr:hypothetical protein [Anaerolineales bacterium]